MFAFFLFNLKFIVGALHVIDSLVLIFLVLLHSGKGGGLSDLFGGGSGRGRLDGGGAQPRPHHRDRGADVRLHDGRVLAPALCLK